ncbi:MAG: DNA polymerase I [Bacteroidales bacterium]|nr:DNA polymerase I [Bacteroidales bacterium]
MPAKLYIIDGHALIFRMYYAFAKRPMINSKGADMSILYGFTKYLMEMISREQPTHLAVAFDPPGGTFRNEMYPEYKANRAETPQLVIDALEPLTELCRAMEIPVLMLPGFEADDVVGTVAKKLAGPETEVYMVTPDKDYGQLVAEHIFQVKPGKAGGPDEVYGPAEVCAKYGISRPEQVIEMLTLCGDSADNVPGVKGVGEVGAAKLIAKYGSVKEVYEHLGELSERQQAMFEDARGHIALSHELVTIKTDVPIEVSLDEMAVAEKYSPAVADLFAKYEFNSLKKFLSGRVAAAPARGSVAPGVVPGNQPGLANSGLSAESTEPSAAALEFSPVPPAALAAAARAAGAVAIAEGAAAALKDGKILVCDAPCPAEILHDQAIVKYGFDLKKLMRGLPGGAAGTAGATASAALAGRLFDIELMHYLISPELSHAPEVLAASYLGITLEDAEEEEQPAGLFDLAPEEDGAAKAEAQRLAALGAILGPAVRADLDAKGLDKLYDSIEEPLIRVLAKMENAGVKVDLEGLKDFTAQLQAEISSHEAAVRSLTGEPNLNVSSPKQIGDVLFLKLKLDPKAKKGAKGSFTTDEATLTALYDRHPVIGEILEYRAAKKLLSTYIEPLPTYISREDGRIHTTFNQALTATGRLSSSSPNLQNIPVRSERGMTIRKAFVPATPDGFILSADYSQIELRIMAHLSGDEHMTDAFRKGIDVHAATAAKIFGVSPAEVSQEQRRIAKTANFGIIYGISAFGLAQRLHTSVSQAKGIITDYFAAFPAVAEFIEKCKQNARQKGYVETVFGRRRYLPMINSANKTMRELSERNAVNAPIQGTSADIIKLAMISIDRRMAEEGFRSRMILQIHDELLFDTLPEECEALKALVKEEMENVTTLSVPLTVECNYGKNWLEAH